MSAIDQLLAAFDAAADRVVAGSKQVAPGLWLGTTDLHEEDILERLDITEDDLEIELDCWESYFPPDDLTGRAVVSCYTDVFGWYARIDAVALPSGRRLYMQSGADEAVEIQGVGAHEHVDPVMLRLCTKSLEIQAGRITTCGSAIQEIDFLLSSAAPGGELLGGLLDTDLDWVDTWANNNAQDAGFRAKTEAQTALDEGELDEETAAAVLDAPDWFFLLPQEALDEIAALPCPKRRDPSFANTFHPWRRPDATAFELAYESAEARQHVVAAFSFAQRYW